MYTPKDSLEELMARYEKACQEYHQFLKRKREAERPWERTSIDADGKEMTYIDYDEWEEKDPQTCLMFGTAEFNGFNYIDRLESRIEEMLHRNNQRGILHDSLSLDVSESSTTAFKPHGCNPQMIDF